MPVYAIGGEDHDAYKVGAPTVVTASGYDTSWARCALRSTQTNHWYLKLDEQADDTGTVIPAPVTGDTFDFSVNINFTTSASNGSAFLRLRDRAVATVPFDLLVNSSGGGSVHILRVWTGAAYTSVSCTAGWLASTRYRYDVRVYLHASSGFVVVYRDGVEIGRYDGNTLAAGITKIDEADLYGAGTGSCDYSEWTCADGDHRFTRVKTLPPTGAGTATGTGVTGTATNIDETTLSAADLVTYADAGGRLRFPVADVSALINAASMEIYALAVSASARRGASGPQNLTLGGTISGSDFDATVPLAEAYARRAAVWRVNPLTGLLFTPTEGDNLEPAVGAAA